jgi:hypothetical protein
MPNPAAVLRVTGTVHGDPRERVIPDLPAVPARHDDEGNLVARAREGRDGYTVHDLTVLTDGGGFVTVVFRDEAVAAAGGFLPGSGDRIENLPVYQYVSWNGPEGRRFAQAALSFAGSVYADERGTSASAGRRLAEAQAS